MHHVSQCSAFFLRVSSFTKFCIGGDFGIHNDFIVLQKFVNFPLQTLMRWRALFALYILLWNCNLIKCITSILSSQWFITLALNCILEWKEHQSSVWLFVRVCLKLFVKTNKPNGIVVIRKNNNQCHWISSTRSIIRVSHFFVDRSGIELDQFNFEMKTNKQFWQKKIGEKCYFFVFSNTRHLNSFHS